MRKKATIKIELDENHSEEVIIYELKVKEILEALDELTKTKETSWLTFLEKWLPRCVSLPKDRLLDLAPSELEGIKETFLEVNKSFLRMLEEIGMKETFQQVKEALKADMKAAFAQSPALPK